MASRSSRALVACGLARTHRGCHVTLRTRHRHRRGSHRGARYSRWRSLRIEHGRHAHPGGDRSPAARADKYCEARRSATYSPARWTGPGLRRHRSEQGTHGTAHHPASEAREKYTGRCLVRLHQRGRVWSSRRVVHARVPASPTELALAEGLSATAVRAAIALPLVLGRCLCMRKRWPWADFERHLEIPLREIRHEYGIQPLQR